MTLALEILMRYDRQSQYDNPSSVRDGFLPLGALSEITLICLAVAVVLIAILQGRMTQRIDSNLRQSQVESVYEQPILYIGHDSDQQTLIVHHWPDDLEEIKLETSERIRRRKPQQLISLSASATSSTIAYLTERARDGQLQHEVYVMQGPQLLLFDELKFEAGVSGTVRVCHDGSIVIVVTQNGIVHGWDLTSREPIHWTYHLRIRPSLSLLSPDGKSLFVAVEKGNLEIREARTGSLIRTFPAQQDSSRSGAWSVDNRRIVVGDQKGTVSVIDIESGERIWHHQVDALFARSLALSSDGQQLAIGTFDKVVRIWNVSQPEAEPIELHGESSTPHNILFLDSDSKLICGGQDGSIREWDIASREILRKLR